MTKEQLIDALTAAVGSSEYGKSLIDEAEKTYDEQDKKYGYTMKDRLDVRLGVLKAYERIHQDAGQTEKAQAEADKIAIIEKALKAIK